MNTKQFMIRDENGKPFIMVAGEVHNSASSSAEFMEHIWDQGKELGLNSLLLPVTWELLEPEEGHFDFSLVDKLILQARSREMKIGFLYFGAWKNAQCMYAPSWVKEDLNRFPRAEVEKGKNKVALKDFYGFPYTSLSYLGEETNKADKKAFIALMKHLKEVDEKEKTVLYVQIENETGLQGAGREHSLKADELFNKKVPAEFVSYMKNSLSSMTEDVRKAVEEGKEEGSWEEVFGACAEEIFSAFYIASYVEKLAKAGKEIYPLPFSVNCWLDKGAKAGIYPSGGPVSRMMEVWKYVAKDVDVVSPDIYVQNFCQICEEYQKLNNPLMIPETAIHSYAALRLVYTIGHYHAWCYSPFGFEDMGKPFNAFQGFLFGMDTSDPLLKTPQNPLEYAYYAKAIDSMKDLLASKYSTSSLQAISSEEKGKDTLLFSSFGFKVIMNVQLFSRKDGVCLIVEKEKNEFFILGHTAMIVPFSTDKEKPNIDILELEDGKFVDGQWQKDRRLNGDEASITLNEPSLIRIKLFSYK
ncbi:MAG: DUF5597 domain-containing protein [Bacilli bacterium]|nr:DUF5597 domain-containing protein [Bacilli bacterium]